MRTIHIKYKYTYTYALSEIVVLYNFGISHKLKSFFFFFFQTLSIRRLLVDRSDRNKRARITKTGGQVSKTRSWYGFSLSFFHLCI